MKAKKSLGQNFLIDRNISARIVNALAPRAGETIFEIGPGQGALTEHLINSRARLIAIEFDRELVPPLKGKFALADNFSIVETDALHTDFCALLTANSPGVKSARLISNLPYNISTAVVQRLIEQRLCLTEMVLMLQREVVERLAAPPSTPERGFLSVLVQMYCEVAKLFNVAPGAFRPAPKVWSTVVRLRPRAVVEIEDDELFVKLLSACFAQRRKTIANNLRAAPETIQTRLIQAGGIVSVLTKSEIAPERRAETLSLTEWAKLTRLLR